MSTGPRTILFWSLTIVLSSRSLGRCWGGLMSSLKMIFLLSDIPGKIESTNFTTARNAVDARWRQAHSNQNNLQRIDRSDIKPSHTRRHTQSIGEFYANEDSPRRNYYHPDKTRLQTNKETKVGRGLGVGASYFSGQFLKCWKLVRMSSRERERERECSK